MHQVRLLLYWPATDEVVWLQAGPWLHQHDVDVASENEIAVLSNNVIKTRNDLDKVIGANDVYVYDFAGGGGGPTVGYSSWGGAVGWMLSTARRWGGCLRPTRVHALLGRHQRNLQIAVIEGRHNKGVQGGHCVNEKSSNLTGRRGAKRAIHSSKIVGVYSATMQSCCGCGSLSADRERGE